jgi:hypothetical protein
MSLWDGVGVCIHAATLPARGSGAGVYCRVVAGLKVPAEKSCDGNAAKSETQPAALSQKGMLKTELKIRRRTHTSKEDRPQMLHGLQQRLNLLAGRWCLLPTQARPHLIQPALPAASQPIERFHDERQPQFFNSSLDRKPGQQLHQPPPHQRSIQRVTRQNVREHNGKCFATAATLPAIGTKHPLATDNLAAGLNRIIAAKNTVPVQRFDFAAAGTALLFEGKSESFSAGSSRTK